jgi:serine protease Do
MIQITEKAEFPHVEMGDLDGIHRGSWCLALGHPGGFQKERQPVLRLGRVLDKTTSYLRTDCTLVGGDSGGPLFDMQGHVIGIHSRIGGAITANIHVPVDTYRDTFDRLAAAEVWGNSLFGGGDAYLGVQMDPDAKGCKIQVISPKSPAEKAGLQVNDFILRIDSQRIQGPDDLIRLIRSKRPGNEVGIEVRRGENTIQIKVVLGKTPLG